jgi:hypothetical protein
MNANPEALIGLNWKNKADFEAELEAAEKVYIIDSEPQWVL